MDFFNEFDDVKSSENLLYKLSSKSLVSRGLLANSEEVLWDHSFSAYAKYSEKLTFPTP